MDQIEAIEAALAELQRVTEADIEVMPYKEYSSAHEQYRNACHPEAIRSLLDRLREAEADARKWRQWIDAHRKDTATKEAP